MYTCALRHPLLIADFPFFFKFLHCASKTVKFYFLLCVNKDPIFFTSYLPHYFFALLSDNFFFFLLWVWQFLFSLCGSSCVYFILCLWVLLVSECFTLTLDCVCVCVCVTPCALYILGVYPAHPVCMVRLQPNGGGQSKMPGSFLLPPPPPVARPVPLPMPDSKIISTPTDGGLTSPASPCKSPPYSHSPPQTPITAPVSRQTSHRGQSDPILGTSRLVSS